MFHTVANTDFNKVVFQRLQLVLSLHSYKHAVIPTNAAYQHGDGEHGVIGQRRFESRFRGGVGVREHIQ